MTIKEIPGATPLDPNERAGLKFPAVATRGGLDELEQANIEQGLAWLGRTRSTDILSETFLCKLHKRLFGDVWKWAGEFRKTEKNIGVVPHQIRPQLRQHLGNTQYWLDEKVFPPKEIAARFHHRIVQIHLFPNGNGRHARIAADVLLEQEFNLPPLNWADGFDLQQASQRRKAYIAALKAADVGNFEPLLEYLEG